MMLKIKSLWPENMEVVRTKCAGRYYAYQLMYYKNDEPMIVKSFEAKDYTFICDFVSNNIDDITPVRLIIALN